ncbi:MAG: L-serine ammonia-lyase, iron-sulfur-dependent, subunit alpha [Clostridiales Family XIII bacterium]|jgi:L-serine dehydratase|nr:L-serine ammonia-lyase, iron-sulfur-dependent, subunit alpha [Clostridiales Family XIII bacterium]
MGDLKKRLSGMPPATIGQTLALAEEFGVRAVDVVLAEAAVRDGVSEEEILEAVLEEYKHNIRAAEIGLADGESILLGTVASQLAAGGARCFDDAFLDDVLLFTLAAQVGNHCIGLRPCAGTGDSCPYTGFLMAMGKAGRGEREIAETAALFLKIGGLFRIGKVTTGCNMEGFGAGAACIAAGTAAMEGGTPGQMGKAVVLAMSPTIGVPCTPRVLVPALCTTHLAGAVLIGMYAARLVLRTGLDVNVPVDVMFAMASEVHKEAAKSLVPTVVDFMEPFFRRKPLVEELVPQEVRDAEAEKISATLARAEEVASGIAARSPSLLHTLGMPVVGGSSQAVGSPTNTARIAHALAGGAPVRKVSIELYPELFARRAINVPGILMGAVFGSPTSDYEMYAQAVQKVRDLGVAVEIRENPEPQLQKVTLETDEGAVFVDARNRGGGRVRLHDAGPSLEAAREAALRLGIVLDEG